MLAFVRELKEELGILLYFVDLGGGIGVPYRDGETVMSPETLAAALQPDLEGRRRRSSATSPRSGSSRGAPSSRSRASSSRA